MYLTKRETETLRYVERGLYNKQIAEELGISLGSVKLYAYHASKKLGTHSRSEAVYVANQLGLLAQPGRARTKAQVPWTKTVVA